jgi:hypothetical protein
MDECKSLPVFYQNLEVKKREPKTKLNTCKVYNEFYLTDQHRPDFFYKCISKI